MTQGMPIESHDLQLQVSSFKFTLYRKIPISTSNIMLLAHVGYACKSPANVQEPCKCARAQ